MGWWDDAKKSVGLGKNGDTGRIVAGFATMGGSEIANAASGNKIYSGKSTFNDLLSGKKAKDISPDAIANEIRKTQSQGLKELNNTLDTTSGEGIVRQGAAQQTKGILSAAQDARRNAQKLMAQRGLQGSSLGLSSQRSIDQKSGADIASINAQLPGQIRNQQLQDAKTRIQAGGINQNGMNFNTIEGQRSGGLLGYASALAPLAGTIGGYMTGNPAAGAAAGQGVGNILDPKKPYDYNANYMAGNTGGY